MRSEPEALPAEHPPRDGRRYVVCPVSELPPGSVRVIPLGRYGVGAFSVGGCFHAVANYAFVA